jgi:putative oxidoreductase
MPAWLVRLTRPLTLQHWTADILVLIPRLVCGYLLTTEFGAPKFGMPWSPPDHGLRLFEVAYWFPTDVAEYGGLFAVAPGLLAWMGAFSEAVGGLFLMLGLQTRLFSFLIGCTMLVAMFAQQYKNGLWAMLPAMGFLWLSVYCMVVGSGRFGVDYALTAKRP